MDGLRVGRRVLPVALAIAAGFAFGAVDQYLGSVHVTSRLGWWTITVSGMSAPWLIVPFLAGMTQERARRAVLLGLVVTMSALAGYFAMSNSVFEGVPVADFWHRTVTMATTNSNLLWIAGGVLTGPVYAYFGHRWRVARSWIGAALVTLALCFEPLARATAGARLGVGALNGCRAVWIVEVALGLGAAIVFASLVVRDRRALRRAS